MAHNLEEIADILRDCADKYIIPRFHTLQSGQIQRKGKSDNDLVTIADKETEAALQKILSSKFPGSIVLGEESVAAGQRSLSALHQKNHKIWVVDPVDGTKNFIDGIPEYAIMLACVENGETTAGWILDIPRQRMMIAEKGSGAFINGDRQHGPSSKPLKACVALVDQFMPAAIQGKVDSLAKELAWLGVRSCAGNQYLEILTGAADLSFYRLCNPWDHLAGALAVTETSGLSMTWNGTVYTPQTDPDAGIVTAANPQLMQELLAGRINRLKTPAPGPG